MPSGTRPLASVVVLARNKSSLTRQCLEALVPSADLVEVLLVDNASTDDTPELRREFAGRFRRVVYRRSTRNLSFSVANNRAAREAAGNVLLFLNNDVIVDPGAVSTLVHTAACTGSVAGAKLLFPGRASIQHAGMKQMLWGYASNLGTAAAADDPRLNRPAAMFAVTGAMLAIPAALFHAVGGFDERFRWGYEDVDLCMKARQAGAAVQYVPEATAVHVESATLARVRRPADLANNYALYRRKWNPRLVPNERLAFARLRRAGMRRVVVFGTGLAATGLARAFRRHDVGIAAFTASTPERGRIQGRPVIDLDEVVRQRVDRLVVASQHFYALEEDLRRFDPAGRPLFPLAAPWDLDERP